MSASHGNGRGRDQKAWASLLIIVFLVFVTEVVTFVFRVPIIGGTMYTDVQTGTRFERRSFVGIPYTSSIQDTEVSRLYETCDRPTGAPEWVATKSWGDGITWTMPRSFNKAADAFTDVQGVALFLEACEALPDDQKCVVIAYSLTRLQQMKAAGFPPSDVLRPSFRERGDILVFHDSTGDEIEVACDEGYVFPEHLTSSAW